MLSDSEIYGIGNIKADLRDADLRELDLQGVDLRYADLRGANMHGSNLSGADFGSANLEGANLSYAQLEGTRFVSIHAMTNLISVDFERANLTKAQLCGVDAQKARFTSATLVDANFGPGSTYQSVLNRANFERTNLENANLSYISMKGVNLSHAELSSAELVHTDLTGANLNRTSFRLADLSRANLSESFRRDGAAPDFWNATLEQAILRDSDLGRVYFQDANLKEADLTNANFEGASFYRASLLRADLTNCDLTNANMVDANLSEATIERAQLNGTDLTNCRLARVNAKAAEFRNCKVFGVSAWGLQIEGAVQENLKITPDDEPAITVDSLEVAQFIYLLIQNENLRKVIDTLTSKAVLILGRFTSDRKPVLDRIRVELRKHNLLPILFDFEGPKNRDVTETVSTLAHMARFIIADLTDPSSIPLELREIVPSLAVPVVPIIEDRKNEFAMFKDLRRKYKWVLDTYRYKHVDHLVDTLEDAVIEPALQMVKKLRQ